MSFDEDFPSLCGDDKTIRTGYYTTGLHNNDGYAICATGIMKHCLDKQKVKEAIERNKIKDKSYRNLKAQSYKEGVNDVLEILKLELGLDK